MDQRDRQLLEPSVRGSAAHSLGAPVNDRGSGAASVVASWRLQLIGGWDLRRDGDPVVIPHRAQRLVAYLGLLGPMPRLVTAGALWPEATEQHAQSNLRTTTHHVRTSCPGLLAEGRDPLDVSVGTFVDVRRLRSVSAREAVREDDLGLLTAHGELLAGWYEDWVIFEQERHRGVRLQRLDEAACRALESGEASLALTLARSAVSLDPLYESALRTLVEVHLRMGNRVEALRVYRAFRARSEREFGIAPSELLQALVRPLLAERAARATRSEGSRRATAGSQPPKP